MYMIYCIRTFPPGDLFEEGVVISTSLTELNERIEELKREEWVFPSPEHQRTETLTLGDTVLFTEQPKPRPLLHGGLFKVHRRMVVFNKR
jgi:hypothetical protein